MSLAAYVLTGCWRKSLRSSEGAMKYFLMGAFATSFLVYGIALVYGATGTTNLSQVFASVASGRAAAPLLAIGPLKTAFGLLGAAVILVLAAKTLQSARRPRSADTG